MAAFDFPAVRAAFVTPPAAERHPIVVGRAVGLLLAAVPGAPVPLAPPTHHPTGAVATLVPAVAATRAPPVRAPALTRPPRARRLEPGLLRLPLLAVPRAITTLEALALPGALAPGPPLPPGLAPARRTRKPVVPCHTVPPLGWTLGAEEDAAGAPRAGGAPARLKRPGPVARSVLGRSIARTRDQPFTERSAIVGQPHGLTHTLHRLGGHRAHRAVARMKHILHQRGLALQRGAAFADRVQERVQRAR